MILFTTSRKPVQKSRTLARTLSRLIPYSEYITRGKAGIEDLAKIARVKGYEKVCIISERHGCPRAFMFLETSPEPRWGQRIMFKRAEPKKIRNSFTSIIVKGEDAEQFKRLFNILEEEDGGVTVEANKQEWVFRTDKTDVLTIYFGGAKIGAKRDT